MIDRRWLSPRYPPYWHYDVLQALLVLSRLGQAATPGHRHAIDIDGQAPRLLVTGVRATSCSSWRATSPLTDVPRSAARILACRIVSSSSCNGQIASSHCPSRLPRPQLLVCSTA